MLEHISLIIGVKIGDISTVRLYELLFEIALQHSMNLRFLIIFVDDFLWGCPN